MPIISKDVWITKQGHQIEIKLMASSHLLATIHFIENSRFSRSAECALRGGNEEDIALYLEWPIQYESLIAEAVRRGLIYRPVEGIVKSKKVH